LEISPSIRDFYVVPADEQIDSLGIATVLQTGQTPYNWKVKDFNASDLNNAVVYELLVRDFTKDHTFNNLIDTLGYMKRLGVTANKLSVAGKPIPCYR